MTLKYLFKVSPPSAKLDINDVDKLGLGIVSGVLVKDYVVKAEMNLFSVEQYNSTFLFP